MSENKTNEPHVASESPEADTAEDRRKVLSDRLLLKVNHEIRSSVHIILGLTNVIRESELSPQVGSSLHVMRSTAERLLKESADIIDLTRAEWGSLQLSSTTFKLHETLQQAVDLMSILASCKSVRFKLEISPMTPTTVVGDPGRLSQILVTLARTAIDRLERGEISIKVERDLGDAEEVKLRIRIADNGRRIPPKTIQGMFDGNLRQETVTAGRSEVSLMLARNLARMMGGDLWAELEPQIGAVFHLNVRLRPASIMDFPDSYRSDADADLDMRPLKILLADDSADTHLLIRAFLKDTPWRIDSADDGRNALEMAVSKTYDLILMDLDMPELSGHMATREIRMSECLHQRHAVPIVALTAHNEAEAATKSMAAGCTAHVTKPIRKVALIDTIQRYASRT